MSDLFVGGFEGLPREGFEVFGIADHEARRRAIIDTFHPPLQRLADGVRPGLEDAAGRPFHAFLPRLNWPKGYRAFCTWLALSPRSSGYQRGPQLNLGVHADRVTARLGWDATQDDFGRFEFSSRLGRRRDVLLRAAQEEDLVIRVYAHADWPQGSRVSFESKHDLDGSFEDVHRHGVWWELGRSWDMPGDADVICSDRLERETARVFHAVLPVVLA